MKNTIVLLTLMLLVSGFTFAQTNNTRDSIKNEMVIDNKSMNLFSSIGFQKSFFYSIGLGYSRFKGNNYGGMSNYGFYSTFEHTVRNRKSHQVTGLSMGIYVAAIHGGLALETKYQWYKNQKDCVITPKYGIGMGGMILLNYGYNISINNRPFEHLGKHQFSLALSIPALFLKRNNL